MDGRLSAFTSSRRLPEVINWINVRGDLDRKLRDNPILNFLPDGSPNPDRKLTYLELRRRHIACLGHISSLITSGINPTNHLWQAVAARKSAQVPLQLPRGEVE